MDEMKKTISDIMSTKVIILSKSSRVSEAVDVMADNQISCIAICEEERPRGIVTERDILKKIVKSRKNPEDVTLEEIMSSPVITLKEHTSLVTAGNVMKENKIRRFVVVDDEDKIKGLVTQTDLLKATIDLSIYLCWKIIDFDMPLNEFRKKLNF